MGKLEKVEFVGMILQKFLEKSEKRRYGEERHKERWEEGRCGKRGQEREREAQKPGKGHVLRGRRWGSCQVKDISRGEEKLNITVVKNFNN